MLPPLKVKTNFVYTASQDVQSIVASDLLGKFPIMPFQSHEYIFVLYMYNANAILVRPMENQTSKQYIRFYDELYELLVGRGFKSTLQKLDNEASRELKQIIIVNDCNYQLVPPQNLCRNPAEQAIQTFKAHFISTMCTTDTLFPLQYFNELLPQAEIKLKLLRQSRFHPQLLTYAHLHSHYNYNKILMAQAGTILTYQHKSYLGHMGRQWLVFGSRLRTLQML